MKRPNAKKLFVAVLMTVCLVVIAIQSVPNSSSVRASANFPFYKSITTDITPTNPGYWVPDHTGWNADGITVNFFWPNAQPCSGCAISIPTEASSLMDYYSNSGLHVTALVAGVPQWARQTPNCFNDAYKNNFCAPRSDALPDFTNFVRLIADTYKGQPGKLLISDFVIQNEVNHSLWFNVNCTTQSCNRDTWVDTYIQSYIAAAQGVNRPANLLVPLNFHWAKDYDNTNDGGYPIISGMTFLEKFDARLRSPAFNRPDLADSWRLAYHAYPPNMQKPQFSAYDLPKGTFGNVGVVVGWLSKNFPSHVSGVQLTENGISAYLGGYTDAQAIWMCKAFRNVLGTPGITNFSYHRMKDNPDETRAPGYLFLGLFDSNGNPRRAWGDWKIVNDPNTPGYCGYENDRTKTVIKRGYNPALNKHWVSSRILPEGFTEEQGWKLLREDMSAPGYQLTMLYECQINNHTFLSVAANCEGQIPMGPVGYAYTSQSQAPGLVPLYRCGLSNGVDHMVTTSSTCELWGSQYNEGLLGYAQPADVYKTLRRGYKSGQGHWAGLTLPAGFTEEASWGLLPNAQSGTVALYSCKLGTHSFLSQASNCEGQINLGFVGYAYTNRIPGTTAIYRCRHVSGDHLITTDANCENWGTNEGLLGDAEPLGLWYGPAVDPALRQAP